MLFTVFRCNITPDVSKSTLEFHHEARIYRNLGYCYLAARLSRDVVVGHQQITQEWWDVREEWRLYVSALVHSEAKSGDVEASKRRVALLANIPPLELTTAVYDLANPLVVGAALPDKAKEDAFHIANATAHGMDYLLT
jgi:hypothetical protein